jgi:hypothetical protein
VWVTTPPTCGCSIGWQWSHTTDRCSAMGGRCPRTQSLARSCTHSRLCRLLCSALLCSRACFSLQLCCGHGEPQQPVPALVHPGRQRDESLHRRLGQR